MNMNMNNKKGLLIAEKPSLARTIKNVYNKNKSKIPYNIDFVEQRGHLLTLKTPNELDESLKSWNWEDLPIEPENLGGWQYKVIKEKKTNPNFLTSSERYKIIKEKLSSGQYDFVINAGDPDQEGELLIRIVLDKLNNKLPIYRYWQNATTDEKVLEGLLNLKNDEEDPMLINLLNAAYGRQHSDYRVGMNLSRAVSMKMNTRAAIGRVKTAIQNIVVKREDEINNFVPTTKYGILSNYKDGFNGVLFNSEDEKNVDEENDSLKDIEKKSGIIWFDKKEDAEGFLENLGNKGEVLSYNERKVYTKPPKFYKLSTAQTDGGKLGYSPSEVKDAIQFLYENKLVSYPRSDVEQISSTEDFSGILENILSQPKLNRFSSYINEEAINKVKSDKRWVDDKFVETKGHTGIIPTNFSMNVESLSKREKDIYQIICNRFLAAFLPPLIETKVDLVVDIDNSTFKTNGKSLVDKGFTELLPKNNQEIIIPKYNKGDILDVIDYTINESTTQKPKRFTTTELIDVCERPHKYLDDESLKSLGRRLHVGTPATTDSIIDGLIKKDKYLICQDEGRRKNVVSPSDIGYKIIKNLDGMTITKVDMTGQWEEMLEEVRSGERNLESLENEMKIAVSNMIKEIKNRDMKQLENKDSKFKEIGDCPKCGGRIIKGPKAYFCSNYKENGCKVGGFYKRNEAIITENEFFEMLNDGKQIEKEMKYKGKIYKQKVGVNEEGTIINITNSKKTSLKCPSCGKDIVESSKAFYCSGNKDKSCKIGLSKNINGVSIPKEEIERLFIDGKTNLIKGFVSKNNEEYNAYFFYDKKEDKINMKAAFPEKETDFICPICGKKLLRSKYTLSCKGNHDNSCHFSMYSQEYKKDIPDEKIRNLLFLVKENKIGGGEYAFLNEDPIKTDYKCPKCGGNVIKKDSKFYCENKKCDFSFYRNIGSDIMLDSDIDDLFKKGETKTFGPFKSKNGSPYFVKNKLDDNDNVVLEYVNKEIESSKKCPICGENLKQSGLKYTCPSCYFDMFAMAGTSKLSDKDLNDLLEKGETRYIDMTFKSGKSGTAKIVVDKENKKTKLEFKPKY